MNDNSLDFEEIINLYNTIKKLYALCEETDPELNTNLQPLNEFRASLDHLMRIFAIEHLDEYKEKNIQDEIQKLFNNLKRAFFDISDMLAVNYRNKIYAILKKYDIYEIQTALPTYYSKIRPKIEEISNEIATLRTEKRFGPSDSHLCTVDTYYKIIEELQGYYVTITNAEYSLAEIKCKRRNKDNLTHWIIPIVSVIVGAVIGIVGWFI